MQMLATFHDGPKLNTL